MWEGISEETGCGGLWIPFKFVKSADTATRVVLVDVMKNAHYRGKGERIFVKIPDYDITSHRSILGGF